jgi:hypothetical protein
VKGRAAHAVGYHVEPTGSTADVAKERNAASQASMRHVPPADVIEGGERGDGGIDPRAALAPTEPLLKQPREAMWKELYLPTCQRSESAYSVRQSGGALGMALPFLEPVAERTGYV